MHVYPTELVDLIAQRMARSVRIGRHEAEQAVDNLPGTTAMSN